MADPTLSLSAEQIETWTGWARRDDWHNLFVGSEIRQMLGEIGRLHTTLAAEIERRERAERALAETQKVLAEDRDHWNDTVKDFCEAEERVDKAEAELAALRAPVGELIDLADRVKYEPIEQIAEHYYAAAMILAARSREISDNYQQKVEWCERLCAQVRERDERIAGLEKDAQAKKPHDNLVGSEMISHDDWYNAQNRISTLRLALESVIKESTTEIDGHVYVPSGYGMVVKIARDALETDAKNVKPMNLTEIEAWNNHNDKQASIESYIDAAITRPACGEG